MLTERPELWEVKNMDVNPERVEKSIAPNKKSFRVLIVMLLAVVILVAGSIAFYIGYSNRSTEKAVHNVSLFYLEELASNVSQVFATHFDGYLKELRLALLTTARVELNDETALTAHLTRMAQRSDFLFYALLDEEGNVYISDRAYLSDFLISFLLECDFNGDEITLEQKGETEDDVFIIAQAAPEEITIMNGKKIIAGAKGIADSKVRREILLRGEDNSGFAHMIMSDGTYIIAGDNEKLVHSDNYFTDLRDIAEFIEGYSLEKMMQDIQEQTNGSIAYYIDGAQHYTYYSFLPRSGWSIALTVPFNTVSATMQETARTVTMGGVILMLLMVVVVAVIFYIYFRQKRVSMELDIQRLEAEERNKAKSSFLSSMSHDIRTPMNAIIGFTNLALQQDNNQRVQDYLTKISTSSNHLLSLINDVLDMSRIESGKMTIDETKCNLADILHGLHTIIQGQVSAKQQHLYVDAVDVVDENIWCDKMRLNQVLLNFLSNAVKFTPAGGTITVLVKQNESNRPGYGAYEFHVKDTGIGMSKEFSKKVFEPFERERTATVNGIQGTGLGMSIAKNIIDMMGGTVRVETELGKGTEFIVNVELRLQEEAETAKPIAIESLKGLHALVVDDDFAACDGVIKMLHRLEMEADWTMSGREAVLRIKQSKELGKDYEVFIIDWQLPDLNGLEVIRQIRESTDDKTPILLMSSYSWSDVEVEAKKAGVTAFCSKPLFMSDLRRLLLEMIAKKEEDGEIIKELSAEKFEGKRILLAEDNELNREIALEILQGYGFIVDTAENGKLAVEKVAASKPGFYDVVLMDVQMPIMNGYEASKAIRQMENPELSAIPILAMTANAFEEDKQNSLAAGMNGHITKPIDMSVLLEILKQHL